MIGRLGIFMYQDKVISAQEKEINSEDVQVLYKTFKEVLNTLKAEDTKKFSEEMRTAGSIPVSQAHMWGDWSRPAVQSGFRMKEEALISLSKDFEASFEDEPSIAEKIISFCRRLLGENGYTYCRAKNHLEKYSIWKHYFEKAVLTNLTSEELLSLLQAFKRENPDLVISLNLDRAKALPEALNSLTSLTYTGRNLSVRDIKAITEALKTNITLTTLIFNSDSYSNGLGLEGIKTLAEALKINTTLTTFSFGCHNAEFGIEGGRAIAEALQANTTLTTLELRSINFRTGGVKAIAEALKMNRVLTTLLLTDETPDEGVKDIAEALKTNPTLTTLRIKTTERGAKALAELLKANTTLATLKFECNICIYWFEEIKAGEGIRAMAEALQTNTILTTLEFRCNNGGGAEGVKAIKAVVEVLKVNTTLTTLRLKDRASNEVVEELAEALKVNRTLTTLELSCDWSGIKGIEAIAEALKTNVTLTILELECHHLEAIKALAEALKINTTLTTLKLKNRITDEGIEAIAEALKINRTLTTLEFSRNRPSDVKGIKAIAESLKINTALFTLNVDPDFPNIPKDEEAMKSIRELLLRNRIFLYKTTMTAFKKHQIPQNVSDIILTYVDPTLLLLQNHDLTKSKKSELKAAIRTDQFSSAVQQQDVSCLSESFIEPTQTMSSSVTTFASTY